METNKKKGNKIHFHIHPERNKHNYKVLKSASTNVFFEIIDTIVNILGGGSMDYSE